MNNNTLKKDFYDKIYDKVYTIVSNISNQYLDNLTESARTYPFVTLKTSIEFENVGMKLVEDRGGKIRIVVYDLDYETMCDKVSLITEALESGDDEMNILSWDEDDDQLDLESDKPYYTAIDITVDLFPNG